MSAFSIGFRDATEGGRSLHPPEGVGPQEPGSLATSAPCGEKSIQETSALFHEHATKYIHAMIHGRHGENIRDAAGGPGFWIPRAKHQPRDARMDDRRSTHDTGLER